MTFFDDLFGFAETTGEEVRAQLELDETRLTSLANGRSFEVGRLTTPSLAELRAEPLERTGRLRVREIVADARSLHADRANAGAFFQVASQFNLLEMVGPEVTPEEGVGIYEHDRTQGPACAIACAPGTVYRNWLVPFGEQRGQTQDRQLDCLADLHAALGGGLWEMRNGYALVSEAGLQHVDRSVSMLDTDARNELIGHLRIGIQRDTEVTAHDAGHVVTQAYCSALPVSYSNHPASQWETFARLVLDASYEATLRAAALHAQRSGNRDVYLTLLGGGAFGNDSSWIVDAIERALEIVSDVDLDVRIVSFGTTTGRDWFVSDAVEAEDKTEGAERSSRPTWGGSRIRVVLGDITNVEVDVIVNAANSSLLGGGGVDGAIHRAAGPGLLEACRSVVARQGGCDTGEAVITHAGNLHATHVVHTVGPVFTSHSLDEHDALLARCYRESLRLGADENATSIAFPCISTGVYRFPKERAAQVATEAVRSWLGTADHNYDEIVFVCFDEEDFDLYVSLVETGSAAS